MYVRMRVYAQMSMGATRVKCQCAARMRGPCICTVMRGNALWMQQSMCMSVGEDTMRRCLSV